MPRGGARSGAGRKKGETPTTRVRRELAASVVAQGITPLEIMMTTMRDLWSDAGTGKTVNLGKRMQACAIAEKVAPYCHPKLSAIEHTGPEGGPIQTESIPTDPIEASKAYQKIVSGTR